MAPLPTRLVLNLFCDGMILFSGVVWFGRGIEMNQKFFYFISDWFYLKVYKRIRI